MHILCPKLLFIKENLKKKKSVSCSYLCTKMTSI